MSPPGGRGRLAWRAAAAVVVMAGVGAAAAGPAPAQLAPAQLAPAQPAPAQPALAAAGPHRPNQSGPSGSSTTTPLPAATPLQPINVLDQTSYVAGPKGTWSIELGLSGHNAASGHLAITVYSRLYTRTAFRQSLTGTVSGGEYQSGPIAVTSLPRGPHGGVELQLPINRSAPAQPGVLRSEYLSNNAFGVYPVQIGFVDSNGATIGNPVTTYVVWVPGPTGFPKLDVSWVLHVQARAGLTSAGLPARIGSRQSAALGALADTLARSPAVPVSIQADPQTLASLNSAGPSGRATIATLAALVGGPDDQLLPSPYAPADLSSLNAAGLGGEVDDQLTAGAATLRSVLRTDPPDSTWVVSDPLDPATASLLHSRGATRLVVPDNDLNALPYNYTFAQPAALDGAAGVQVVAADSGLDVHFTDSGDQVLQAQQLLAELAMIDSETPGQTRGVVILTPSGWTPQASFVGTVLSGLAGNPLLQAVSVDQLFASVPPASNDGDAVSRTLSLARAAPFPAAGAVHQARHHLATFSATFPGAAQQGVSFAHHLLFAESSTLSAGQRSAALNGLAASIRSVLARVSIPPGVSITLTARNGNVPVTVVDRGPVPARVRVQLTSQKLTFRAFSTTSGRCRSNNPTTVVCRLVLTGPAVTLKIPVETRTTGVFSLVLAVRSSDGSLVLNQTRYTVRSTAVSVVAVVLMIGAALLLAVWWVRDRRHGRRARQLVPPPGAEGDGPEDMDRAADSGAADFAEPEPDRAPGPDRGAPEPDRAPAHHRSGDGNGAPERPSPTFEDPVVTEFFASLPPRYEGGDPPSPGAGQPR